jgi:hypothetical protein
MSVIASTVLVFEQWQSSRPRLHSICGLREDGAGICFWTTRSVRRVAEPVVVVGHISDCSVLSVATSTSAFSIRND